ncbi:GspH/FimT family pseudopilin [Hyphobacterium sp.]|uniref:GspH/FimT family pseudopilin n=1 Tax=Hyphobacterium sp. TaxID=2004662 RepID=UPI003BA94AF8
MRTSSERCNNARGYTLTELLVVLIVLGLAVALTAPALFRATPQSRLNNSLDRLEQAARAARSEARLTGRDTLLTLDTEARTIALSSSDSVIRLDPRIDIRATVAERELDGDRASIRFFPDGAATGGTILMTLDEQQAAARISWLTGSVEEIAADEID